MNQNCRRGRILGLCCQALRQHYYLQEAETAVFNWSLQRLRELFNSELKKKTMFKFVQATFVPQQPWPGQLLLKKGEESSVQVVINSKPTNKKLDAVKRNINHVYMADCSRRGFPPPLKIICMSEFLNGKLKIGLRGCGFDFAFSLEENIADNPGHYQRLITTQQDKANLVLSGAGLMAFASLRQLRNQEIDWKCLSDWQLQALVNTIENPGQQALANDVQPVIANDVQPVIANDVQPVIANDVQPAIANDVQPVIAVDVQPVIAVDVQPAIANDVQPAIAVPQVAGGIVLQVLRLLMEQQNVAGIIWPPEDPVSGGNLLPMDARTLNGVRAVAQDYFRNPTKTVNQVLNVVQIQALHADIGNLPA